MCGIGYLQSLLSCGRVPDDDGELRAVRQWHQAGVPEERGIGRGVVIRSYD